LFSNLIKQLFHSHLLDVRRLWPTLSVTFYPGARLKVTTPRSTRALSNMNSYVTIEICYSLVLFVAMTALTICKYAMTAFNSKCKYEKEAVIVRVPRTSIGPVSRFTIYNFAILWAGLKFGPLSLREAHSIYPIRYPDQTYYLPYGITPHHSHSEK